MKPTRYSPEQASEDISARWLHAVRDVRKPVSKPAPLFWQSIRELCAILRAVCPRLLLALSLTLGAFGVWLVSQL